MLAILYIICMNIHQNLALERNKAYNGVIPNWKSREYRNRFSVTSIQVHGVLQRLWGHTSDTIDQTLWVL